MFTSPKKHETFQAKVVQQRPRLDAECKMPNDYEILWLGLDNWLNQVSGQFPQYNDPEGNLISSFTKHQSHSTFCIWHLANTEHRG